MSSATMNTNKARVFISCGQAKNTTELEAAQKIASRLTEMGFEPYIAVEQQSLRGLKESIFAQLGECEYFLFIDFKREEFVGSTPAVHRGSLFSHQELAIASYLDLPLLAFQEDGVKSDDGLLRFLQGNAIAFSDRRALPAQVADAIQRRGWACTLRNDLHLEVVPQFVDARAAGTMEVRRFFHIVVRNRHHHKTARDCYVYLERAGKVRRRAELAIQTCEFKWAGYTLPFANIAPRGERIFDAFHVHHARPSELGFNTFSDSTQFIPKVSGPGDFSLGYLVVSDNFPPSRITVEVHVGNSVDDATMSWSSPPDDQETA